MTDQTATIVPTATGASEGNGSTQPRSKCFHDASAARARSIGSAAADDRDEFIESRTRGLVADVPAGSTTTADLSSQDEPLDGCGRRTSGEEHAPSREGGVCTIARDGFRFTRS